MNGQMLKMLEEFFVKISKELCIEMVKNVNFICNFEREKERESILQNCIQFN